MEGPSARGPESECHGTLRLPLHPLRARVRGVPAHGRGCGACPLSRRWRAEPAILHDADDLLQVEDSETLRPDRSGAGLGPSRSPPRPGHGLAQSLSRPPGRGRLTSGDPSAESASVYTGVRRAALPLLSRLHPSASGAASSRERRRARRRWRRHPWTAGPSRCRTPVALTAADGPPPPRLRGTRASSGP